MLSRQVSDGHVDVGGIQLPYQVAGEGDTVVHLRRGGAAPETVGILAKGFRVLALDLASEQSGGDAEAAATGLAGALRQLGHEKFGVIAQPDCAAAALWLAVTAPDAVESLVLVAPTLIDASGTMPDAALAARLPEVQPHVLAMFGTRDTVAPPAVGRRYREKLARCHLVFVYDAGCAIEQERPAAAAVVMEDFLKRREKFIVSGQNGQLYP